MSDKHEHDKAAADKAAHDKAAAEQQEQGPKPLTDEQVYHTTATKDARMTHPVVSEEEDKTGEKAPTPEPTPASATPTSGASASGGHATKSDTHR
jgi:hypothetical protein